MDAIKSTRTHIAHHLIPLLVMDMYVYTIYNSRDVGGYGVFYGFGQLDLRTVVRVGLDSHLFVPDISVEHGIN